MNSLKRILKRSTALMLVLSVIISLFCFGSSPLKANAVKLDNINDNQYYYIKNLRSGKFLTVQHNVFTAGQNIVQWSFTGANNQKWKMHYMGDPSGNYRLLAYNTNLALSMETQSVNDGVKAVLAASTDNASQFMYPTPDLGNGAHRFYTRSSNSFKVLVAQNASIANGAYIVQGSTGGQWNDQWLIEPVESFDVYMAINYGQKNYNHRLATYPDFGYYNGSNLLIRKYESTNYVSQCLTAGGRNYYRTGSFANWWFVSKNVHVQNQTFDFTDLPDYWTISEAWYDPSQFKDFLCGTLNCSTSSIEHANCLTGNSGNTSSLDEFICFLGDTIFIKRKTNSVTEIIGAVYATETKIGSILADCNVVGHIGSTTYNNTTLKNVLLYLNPTNSDSYSLEIVHTCLIP